MRKSIWLVIVLIFLFTASLSAQEDSSAPGNTHIPQIPFGFTIDYGYGFGNWGGDGFDDWRILMSQRVGFLVDFGYSPLPFITFGAEVGARIFYFDMIDWETGEEYGFFLDLPVRGFLRFGAGMFFIQPFGGYYFSLFNKYLQGAEVGIKVSFFGVVLEGSYVFGDLPNYYWAGWDNKDYWRIAVGFRFDLSSSGTAKSNNSQFY